MVAFVADTGDDGALHAANQAGLVIELLHRVGDLLDVLFTGSRLQHDDHSFAPYVLYAVRFWAIKKPSRACGTVWCQRLGINTQPADRAG